jgi:hypothetical protein
MQQEEPVLLRDVSTRNYNRHVVIRISQIWETRNQQQELYELGFLAVDHMVPTTLTSKNAVYLLILTFLYTLHISDTATQQYSPTYLTSCTVSYCLLLFLQMYTRKIYILGFLIKFNNYQKQIYQIDSFLQCFILSWIIGKHDRRMCTSSSDRAVQ